MAEEESRKNEETAGDEVSSNRNTIFKDPRGEMPKGSVFDCVREREIQKKHKYFLNPTYVRLFVNKSPAISHGPRAN